MEAKRNIISKVLLDKKVCCLCFKSQLIANNHVDDLVVLDSGCGTEEMAVSQVLDLVLGVNVPTHSQIDYICIECLKDALTSYRFIKRCKENLELFQKSVETLENCFHSSFDYEDSIKTIIASINVDNVESVQHCDIRSMTDTQTALRQLKTISKHNTTKNKKPRVCNQDVTDICYVIRKDNCPTKYKCKICSYTSIRTFNLKKHYYSQHGAKSFQCTVCTRSYGSDTLLKKHVNDSHRKTVCSECGQVYHNRYSLSYHMRIHSGELPYKCKHCGLGFRSSSRRAEHVRRFHLEPSAECNICHVKFRCLGSLYSHRRRHCDPNSRLHVASNNIGLEAGVAEEVLCEKENDC